MADEPRDDEFDLRLSWPRDAVITPVAGRDDLEPSSAPEQAPDEPAGEASEAAVAEDEPAAAYTATPLEQIVVLANELGGRFDALARMASAGRDAAGANLLSYAEELDLLHTASAGALSQYRERHLRMLVELRRAFGGDTTALGWISGNLTEMSNAVDEAIAAVSKSAQHARTALDDGRAAVEKLAVALVSVGDRLMRSISEVESSIRQGGETQSGEALLAIGTAIAEASEQLRAAPSMHPRARPRLEEQLERVGDQLSAFGERDTTVSALTRALDAAERAGTELGHLAAELAAAQGEPDVAMQNEVARLADEFQAVRRRMTLRSKAPVSLTDDQIELLAKAVAAEMGRSPGAPAERSGTRSRSAKSSRERPLRPKRD